MTSQPRPDDSILCNLGAVPLDLPSDEDDVDRAGLIAKGCVGCGRTEAPPGVELFTDEGEPVLPWCRVTNNETGEDHALCVNCYLALRRRQEADAAAEQDPLIRFRHYIKAGQRVDQMPDECLRWILDLFADSSNPPRPLLDAVREEMRRRLAHSNEEMRGQ
jgi:hypothetical protein